MPSRLYTNADLVPRKALSIQRERAQEPSPMPDPLGFPQPTSAQDIDKLVAEAQAHTDQEIARAHKPVSDLAAQRAEASLSPMGVAKRYGKALLDPALMAASFVPGPIGMAANTVYAGQAAKDMYQHPSVGNAVGLGLSMLPGIGHLRGLLGKGAKAAGAVGKEARVPTSIGSEFPYRPRYASATPSYPRGPVASPYQPSGVRQAARTIEERVDVPVTQETGASGGPDDTVEQILASLGAKDLPQIGVKQVNAAKLTPADWAELNTFMGKGVSDSEKAVMRHEVSPGVTRVPRGVSGDEYSYAGQKVQPYGPSTQLTPEEAAAAPEFEDAYIQDLLDSILHARR